MSDEDPKLPELHEDVLTSEVLTVLNQYFVNSISLTVSQLTEIIAKKLLNYQFCSIKKGASSSNMKMQDIIVHKEISL